MKNKQLVQTKEIRSRGIALSDEQYRVLVPLALKKGHTSRSRVVQELIEREAKKVGLPIRESETKSGKAA